MQVILVPVDEMIKENKVIISYRGLHGNCAYGFIRLLKTSQVFPFLSVVVCSFRQLCYMVI